MFDCVYIIGAVVGLISYSLHKQYLAESALLATGISPAEFKKNFAPRMVDKTTTREGGYTAVCPKL